MSKKKRNKQYKGRDAAAHTSVTKVSAVKRNKVHQWWVDNKRLAKPVGISILVAIGIIIILIGLIDIIW